jgi:serine/threonine-protein kinase
MADEMTPLAVALRERYTFERRLGSGGMATVYLARDLKHDRPVAIKVLRPELWTAIGAKRFLAEIRTTANLHHPHILPLHDSGEADGIVYYVMPYVDGESLRARLSRETQLPVEDAVLIATEVADALQRAHEQGVIHRDIKPENILLSGGHALVADFGIALAPSTTSGGDTRMTEAGISLGTPMYMSPEQAMGEQSVDARSDVYALGCVLYEMLTGTAPFTGPTAQSIIAKVVTERPQPMVVFRESVPEHLEVATMKALARLPADRFRSAREFAAALRDPLSTGRPTSVATPRNDRWWAMAAAALLLAVGGTVAVRLARRSSTGASTPAVPAAQKVTVLIGGVENRTGDSTFDAVLPELLATTLEQSGTVAVYPRGNVGFVLRRMERPPTTAINDSVGREIVAREGLSAVVLQSITKLGNSYVVVVRAVLPDGNVMNGASIRQSLAAPGDLPAVIDTIGAKLRQALGESAEALASSSVPLEQVTSRSLDAVRFYSQGKQRIYAGDPRGAITLFRRATELDPQFGVAHGALGAAYSNVQDHVGAAEALKVAASLASRVPALEREKILGDFALSRRDFFAACPHFAVLVAARPRDYAAHLSLGWCSVWSSDFETAVSETERAFELQPSPRTQINRAMVAFLSGDLKKALDNAEAVRAQAPMMLHAGFVAGKAQLAGGDFDGARVTYTRMVSQGGDLEIEGHNGLADLARSTGRLDEARTHLETARQLAATRGNVFVATFAAAELAELALDQGSNERYQAAMAKLPASSPDPWLVYRIGRARARGNQEPEARKAINEIAALSIGPSRQHDALKALLRAEIALAASRAAEAVSEAEAAVRYEPTTVAHETLARAYLMAKRPAEAATAFEQVVTRPHGRCESYDAPACYRVMDATYWSGRMKQEAGDRAGAEPLLRRFVTAWSGASGPMLEDARRRLGDR